MFAVLSSLMRDEDGGDRDRVWLDRRAHLRGDHFRNHRHRNQPSATFSTIAMAL
jgi:hypothetical protein